jgi:hypothetical protein
VQDWVPAGHLVHFVLHIVREELDLKPILKKYDEERGYPPALVNKVVFESLVIVSPRSEIETSH